MTCAREGKLVARVVVGEWWWWWKGRGGRVVVEVMGGTWWEGGGGGGGGISSGKESGAGEGEVRGGKGEVERKSRGKGRNGYCTVDKTYFQRFIRKTWPIISEIKAFISTDIIYVLIG